MLDRPCAQPAKLLASLPTPPEIQEAVEGETEILIASGCLPELTIPYSVSIVLVYKKTWLL